MSALLHAKIDGDADPYFYSAATTPTSTTAGLVYGMSEEETKGMLKLILQLLNCVGLLIVGNFAV